MFAVTVIVGSVAHRLIIAIAGDHRYRRGERIGMASPSGPIVTIHQGVHGSELFGVGSYTIREAARPLAPHPSTPADG